ncbi:PDZ domain-containing protein [Aldersonia sp. NBC_00410]|uniref:YlbL family protein n=1 Tax=Aldersonia sp. NBC_00410 TaxID=2975954 RepID=UPI0022580F9B|nr:PDZ domain-containing protein [Aldersonia sp. NBC_00410]MCX5044605.1 PDZ domain-containing protein [Aldersonia sp. NBC_00410]
MNRRIVTLIAALIPIVVLGVIGSTVTVPYAALGRGPTFNTLGEVDGKPVVDIQGTAVDPTTGNLNMTTVSVKDGLTIFDALGLWASGRDGIVPRSEVFPPDKSREEIDQSNQADFAKSEDNAEVAALRFLNYPTVVRVDQVGSDSPANDALQPGDELISINGVAVDSVAAVQQTVSSASPGTTIEVRYRRDGVEGTAAIRLAARPDDAEKGYLGITPVEVPTVPFTIEFNLADIGGPSAGLMFSLAVVDKLSPGELTNGTFVAGTGTIDAAGEVGPIGGIPYKMGAAREAGATTFLVPEKNCDEARQQTPDGLRLVKVSTLDDAVHSLNALASGGDAPSCG